MELNSVGSLLQIIFLQFKKFSNAVIMTSFSLLSLIICFDLNWLDLWFPRLCEAG